MKKRLVGTVFLALTILCIAATVASAPGEALEVIRKGWAHPEILALEAEYFFQEHLPFSQELGDLYLTLRVAGGNREVDGLLLVEDGLVENFAPAVNSQIRRENGEAILDFAQNGDTSAYFMLLPTACAVYQDRVPSHISLYNQRSYLEEVSREFAGSITAVDAYLPLFYARDQYLYYRTSPGLTALGQYTVYQTLAKRLGFLPRSMGEFSLHRVSEEYYGSLYKRWKYSGVRGDVVSYYQNTAVNRAFEVKHWERYEQRTYYSLFPQEAVLEGDSTAVILGGSSPRIEITAMGAVSAPSLLVVGDESALGMLPFLALHYRKITFVNLGLLTDSEIADIPAEGYDHLLFLYSLDTYMNTDIPAKVAGLGQLTMNN